MPKTPEHRAKIAATLKGRAKTEEHRANIREAQRHRRQRDEDARTAPAEWTPDDSRRAVINAVRSGRMPQPQSCTVDPAHDGPYEWDHCDPDVPYSYENRYVVQALCRPCHVRISAERRDGRGYRRRERTCEHCDAVFYARPSLVARFCSRACYDAHRRRAR